MGHLWANWNAPPTVKAFTTTRLDGVSQFPYEENNLALHVGDNEMAVYQNRRDLREKFCLAEEPFWLDQTHSTHCVIAEEESTRQADAAITRQMGLPLAILTADCLPIVLCNQTGTEIAAVHAGWKGLANGIIENTLQKMQSPTDALLAWIGPGICQACYKVGPEMVDIFCTRYPPTASTFTKKQDQYHANLAKMAEIVLQSEGVPFIFQSEACTFENKEKYYSYRRQPQTGRMATLIWLDKND